MLKKIFKIDFTKLPLDSFMTDALTGLGIDDGEYSFVRFCLEHFIRQTKLKICDLPVFQELMVVVVGAQDQGKTSALRYLSKPLNHFYSERGLKDISEPEKNCRMFEDNFIILCEEMQNAEKTNIETFKSIVTSKYINARIYYSQGHATIKNNATLIGTSNKPTSEGIYDTTGMRRFIDIDINIPKCDFELLEKIDYLAIWQGVKHILSPEEKKQFFEYYNKTVKPKQEEMRARDCIEDFIEDQKIERGDILSPTSKAYERYRQWCSQNGYNHPKNSRMFSKRLIRLLKIPSGKNYKDSLGNRALPLNKYLELANSYYKEF